LPTWTHMLLFCGSNNLIDTKTFILILFLVVQINIFTFLKKSTYFMGDSSRRKHLKMHVAKKKKFIEWIFGKKKIHRIDVQ
jgi:hypothetical protein